MNRQAVATATIAEATDQLVRQGGGSAQGGGSLFEGGHGGVLRFDVSALAGLETLQQVWDVFGRLGDVVPSRCRLVLPSGPGGRSARCLLPSGAVSCRSSAPGRAFAFVCFISREKAQEILGKAQGYDLKVDWLGAAVLLTSVDWAGVGGGN